MTFFAPACICPKHFSVVKVFPVQSMTMSAPTALQGICEASRNAKTGISAVDSSSLPTAPRTSLVPSSYPTRAGNTPCAVSRFNILLMSFSEVRPEVLIPTIEMSPLVPPCSLNHDLSNYWPIRPKPFMPTLICSTKCPPENVNILTIWWQCHGSTDETPSSIAPLI